jgi:(p)ppGpp synthase/HD superfamily hydrolase
VTDVITRAADFARDAHNRNNQRRKYSNLPYITHPEAVANMVASVTDDAHTIAAAWLHDVVEDTPVTIGQIETQFGKDIAGLVADLTKVSKDKVESRKKRVELDRHRLAAADPRAKTIKLADIMHNLSDLADRDAETARVYVPEKESQLQVLGDGDGSLFRQATQLIGKLKGQLA